MRQLEDARRGASTFRRIVVAVTALCVPCAVMCGGTTTGDGGIDGAMDGYMPGCTTTDRTDSGACVGWSVRLLGDPNQCVKIYEGGTGITNCRDLCGDFAQNCDIDGLTIRCQLFCSVDGRRPPGACEEGGSPHDLAQHFARVAYFERMSAHAFDVLVRELAVHGAPSSLVGSARRARKDEERHGRMAGKLARGTRFRRTSAPPPSTRTLFEIALDNAREGCGRETFGALLGFHQARHAKSRDARRFYRRIARDEMRHASFSWRLHRWLATKLSDSERERVDTELRRTLASVTAPHGSLDAELGVPSPNVVRALAQRLRAVVDS